MNNNDIVTTGFSIWLMPDSGDVKNTLSSIIAGYSIVYKTPIFEPHVTLLGGIKGQEEEVIDKTYKLARNIKNPIEMNTLGVGYLDNVLRSVFFYIESNPDLLDANIEAQRLFDLNEDYSPHMSLLYGDIPVEEKLKIESNVGEMHRSFMANSLFLYNTDCNIKDWSLVDKFLIE